MSEPMQVIEITVSPEGEVTVQTRGFTGPACRQASRFIEQALGEQTSEQLTAEFFQSNTVQQQAKQRQ